MPTLTLKPDQVQQLSTFLRENNRPQFFLAKDQGAYIGATAGKDDTFKNIIFYFKGCDPKKDADFYENARAKFGGDDFGEQFKADVVHTIAKSGGSMRISVSPSSIRIDELRTAPAKA